MLSRKVSKQKRGKNRRNRVDDDGVVFSVNGAFPRHVNSVSSQQVIRVNQSADFTAILSSSVTLETFFARSFQLSDLDQVSSLTAVFDQYRIDMIEFWLVPRSIDSTSNTSSHGLLTTVIDYDDATALTTTGQANDFNNALTSSGLNGHYRKFKPHIALAAYTGVFTSFANADAGWIDAASTGVQHYGIKGALTVTDAVYVYDAFARYHLSFRNLR